MSSRSTIDVFLYLDYRAFLRDTYTAKKAEGRGFSFRAFSRRAGLKSPNHLKRVMEGERNITAATATRYAAALDLRESAAVYFCDLVAFNQARTPIESETAYVRLSGNRGYQRAQSLDQIQSAYHSTWYLPAIRELVLRADFVNDPTWVALALRPTITPAEARKALKLLCTLGLLTERDGTLLQSHPTVTTGAETSGVHIIRYHRMMMNRAQESIDLFDHTERDISSLTLAMGPDGITRLKRRLAEFRRELLALSEQEAKNSRQVVQLNLQLFPLSTKGADR